MSLFKIPKNEVTNNQLYLLQPFPYRTTSINLVFIFPSASTRS
jgi:hypothetical protein